MSAPSIQFFPPSSLTPRPHNPRTHSPAQIQQIADSIRTFGFNSPILVDTDNVIIAGHGRWEAAKLLKLPAVPTLQLGHLSPAEIRAYVIADNKIALNAGWNAEILALELGELITEEADFEVTLTGFSLPEIDVLLDASSTDSSGDPAKPDPADEIPTIDRNQPAVTQLGDVWQLGKHRLICGNSLEADTYAALLDQERAQMVFTDPPYNVPIDGHVTGLGKAHHAEFAMAAGELSQAEFTSFLRTVFQCLTAASQDGSIHFVCIDWRHQLEILQAADGVYSELKNLCVWAKRNGGMGSLYRSQHELIFVFKAGAAPHCNNVELGRHGRYRTNVWSYAGVNGFGRGREEALAMHPTVKPVALVADAILDCSRRKHIVLDAFAGSGTTLVAAERTGRRGFGIELDPYYCDVIVKRFAKLKIAAHLAGTGESFEDVAERRQQEAWFASAASAAAPDAAPAQSTEGHS